MIRAARAADLNRLLAMARRFAEADRSAGQYGFDARSVAQTFSMLMDSREGVLFVAERRGKVIGMAGAFVYPCWFARNKLIAQELIWWVQPEHRGTALSTELHRNLEAWARRAGAAGLEMIALCDDRQHRMEAYYRGQGYEPMETRYVKALN